MTCWVCDDKGAPSGACEECGRVRALPDAADATRMGFEAAEGRARAGFSTSFEEPEGFAQWLGRFCIGAGIAVPKALTPRRTLLARVFGALLEFEPDLVDVLAKFPTIEVEPEIPVAWAWMAVLVDREEFGR